MSTKKITLPESRFLYTGSATGVGGQVTKIDQAKGLNLLVPVQGAVALPAIGGISQSTVEGFVFDSREPKPTRILAVDSIQTKAYGRMEGRTWKTDVTADVKGFHLLDQLHVDHMCVHLATQHTANDQFPKISPNAAIEGLRLGETEIRVKLDLKPFQKCPTKAALSQFFTDNPTIPKQNPQRFNMRPTDRKVPQYNGGYYVCSLAQQIEVVGPNRDDIQIDGYMIYWKNFGRIVVGEMLVSDYLRRITMLRVELGCMVEGRVSSPDTLANGGTLP